MSSGEFTTPGDSDPSHFDADAFLRESLELDEDLEFGLTEGEAETVRFEGEIIAALTARGIDLSRLSAERERVGMDAPLSATVTSLSVARYNLLNGAEPIPAAEFWVRTSEVNADLDTASRISKLADCKAMASMGQEPTAVDYKRAVQAEIYADDNLSSSQKEAWLTTVAEVLPDVEGLDAANPEVLLTVEDYEVGQQRDADINRRAREFRAVARRSLSEFLRQNNIGEHDDLEGLATSLVTGLSRYRASIASGDSAIKDVAELIKRTSIDQTARNDALAMGWTTEQFDAAVHYIQESLKETEL